MIRGVASNLEEEEQEKARSSRLVGGNLWICAIHGSRCAICGIHGSRRVVASRSTGSLQRPFLNLIFMNRYL